MGASQRFDLYMNHLSEGLGHLDRHAGLKGYCTGLMLPLARKSVEPMAARVDPMHASAQLLSVLPGRLAKLRRARSRSSGANLS
jgi:SRSO17 transposase